jgi:LysM repeat protein
MSDIESPAEAYGCHIPTGRSLQRPRSREVTTMTTDNDEFWGDEAGWSTSPERDGTTDLPLTNDPTPARGIGGKASRLWGSLLTSGSKASRAHGADTTGPVDHGFEVGSDQQVEDESNSGTAEWDEGWEVEPTPVPSGGVDPLLAKFGGAAVVLTLLIPVALGFRSGSDGQLIEAAAAAASSAATSSNEIGSAEAAPTSAAGVEPTAGEPTSTSSANSVADTSLTEATPVESATPSTDARSVPELSGSAESSEADSSSGNIAAPAEAEEPAVRVEPVCPVEYEVVVGDFWIRIADGAGVTVSDLLALNNAGSSTPLYPGSSICLPEGARTPPPPPPVTQPPTTAPATTAPATTAAPTTVAPTTTPTTAAPAPPTPTPTAPADIEQIIRDVWPDELEERALEIAWRESNYVPTAKNFCCYGIFQMYWEVHKGWLSDMGITSATQLYDPETNVRAAYALYERAGGWGPWGF